MQVKDMFLRNEKFLLNIFFIILFLFSFKVYANNDNKTKVINNFLDYLSDSVEWPKSLSTFERKKKWLSYQSKKEINFEVNFFSFSRPPRGYIFIFTATQGVYRFNPPVDTDTQEVTSSREPGGNWPTDCS